MTTVVARAMKTPACHTGCGEKEQPVRRSPMRNAALRRARFVVPLPPSPAAPTQATPAKLSCPVLNAPALSRLQCGTCTAPTLGAGWCRVTPTSRGSTVSSVARLLRVFDRLPTGSFQQQQITARRRRRRVDAVGVTRRRDRRRGRPLPTPPTGGSLLHARKRRERMRCPRCRADL